MASITDSQMDYVEAGQLEEKGGGTELPSKTRKTRRSSKTPRRSNRDETKKIGKSEKSKSKSQSTNRKRSVSRARSKSRTKPSSTPKSPKPRSTPKSPKPRSTPKSSKPNTPKSAQSQQPTSHLDLNSSAELFSETDDTFSTAGWTLKTVGSNFTRGTFGNPYDNDVDSLLHGDDVEFVKQRYGVASMVISLIQLLFLTMTMSLCGLAPLQVNWGIGPYPDVLSDIGSTNPYLLAGKLQVWRFITSPLTTSGILHLILNTFIQLEVGGFLEREWGTKKWLAIYFASAIGCVSFACGLNNNSVSVGSTGTLMGLFGAKMSEFLLVMNFKTKKTASDDYYAQQMIVMLLVATIVMLLSVLPFVGWPGHFGGFFCGFVAGMLILSANLKKKNDRKLWVGAGVLLSILLLMTLVSMILESDANDAMENACRFYDDMHDENYECQCGF